VPELVTLSITVTIAPQVAGGLAALVGKSLAKAVPEKPKKPKRTGDTYVNKSSGVVNGTVIQIGRVHNGPER
jgi:hypothetical protein